MTPSDSMRLEALRFPLVVLVVFIHAYEASVRFSDEVVGPIGDGAVFDYLRILISQCVARVAVPVFFLISGYLFAWEGGFSWERFYEKIRSRVRTLLIPFLFWNFLAFCVFFAVQCVPQLRGFDSGLQARIGDLGVGGFFLSFFGFSRAPFAYQFWFIRDLMILALIYPLIRFVVGFCFLSEVALVVIGLVWIGYYYDAAMPTIEALFFFSFGVFLRVRVISPFGLDRYGCAFLLLFLILLIPDVVVGGAPQKVWLHRVAVVLGVVSILFVTSIRQLSAFWAKMRDLSVSSFFVFAAHEPLLTVVRKVYYKVVEPSSPGEVFLGYMICPVFVILIILLVYRVLRLLFPRVLNFVVGAR